jgi:hypothetical protein
MNKVPLGQYLIFLLSLIFPKIHRVNLSVVRLWKMGAFGVVALLKKNPHAIPRMKDTQMNFKKLHEEY